MLDRIIRMCAHTTSPPPEISICIEFCPNILKQGSIERDRDEGGSRGAAAERPWEEKKPHPIEAKGAEHRDIPPPAHDASNPKDTKPLTESGGQIRGSGVEQFYSFPNDRYIIRPNGADIMQPNRCCVHVTNRRANRVSS